MSNRSMIDGDNDTVDHFKMVFPVSITASLVGNASTGLNGLTTYDWTEQEPNSQGVYQNNTIPRTGTKESGPFLVEINGASVSTLPAVVQARYRCAVNGNPYYEFQFGNSAGSSTVSPGGNNQDVQLKSGSSFKAIQQIVTGAEFNYDGLTFTVFPDNAQTELDFALGFDSSPCLVINAAQGITWYAGPSGSSYTINGKQAAVGSGNGYHMDDSGNVTIGYSGTFAKLAFFEHSSTTKLTVTGSRGGNAALANLLTALAAYGLITDGSTA